MRTSITRLSVVMVAASMLSTLGVTGAGAASPDSAKAGSAGPSRAAASPGAELWSAIYGGAETESFVYSVAVSPDGGTVFVTGSSNVGNPPSYVTIAYNAVTGAQEWLATGPGGSAVSVAVSPDGGTVFVTGSSPASSVTDYATLAYSAATGAQLWAESYSGPSGGGNNAASLAVSPSGATVFVTGSSPGATSGTDYATVAYNAVTGAQLWAERYGGPGSDQAASVAVSGSRVFVTGSSPGATSGADYATVAYNAVTGAQLWVRRYGGPGSDQAASVAVRGSRVFVTGSSPGATSGTDYATVAYRGRTGTQLWVKRYNGPRNSSNEAASLAVSGDRVFVTGTTSNTDYATVAYRAGTGARLWVKRYNGPNCNSQAAAVAVSPTGGTVYVTGSSFNNQLQQKNVATVAYDAASGSVAWITNDQQQAIEEANSLAVSPTDGTVFAAGDWADIAPDFDGNTYFTIAYSGRLVTAWRRPPLR